ncbi:cytochrome P450 [Pseudoneurospora amorphoporcata]|uniref:Cytochrome P450 n=1 Tax=Pseudoneurospora amorphoporcata TaxID=241081 RepID=A0AAN6NUN7_9PEZI|nr:cytochrome P450 [Pseudoneurospora amorphoporcata]
MTLLTNFTTNLTLSPISTLLPGNTWPARSTPSTAPSTRASPTVRSSGSRPTTFVTNDIEVFKRINAARSTYNRDGWYEAIRYHPTEEHMFNVLDGARHDKMKARVMVAYGGREVEGVEGRVEDWRWWERDEIGRFGTRHLCSYLTMDVITKLGFGDEFGYLKREEDVFGFLHEFREANWLMGIASDLPYLRNVLFSCWFLRWLGPKKTDKKGFGKLLGGVDEIVEKRYRQWESGKDNTTHRDMMAVFLKNGLTQAEIEHEVVFMITAGSDTTATTMRTTILNVITHPNVYLELKREIFKAAREGKAFNPVRYEEARALPYLQAVIHEGLRIRSPVTALFLKSVPPGGDTICDHFIPGGTAIGVNISAINMSRKLYGDDAEFFRPERFLEVSQEQREEMYRNVESIFGSGRWTCAGQNMAWMELYKFLFELFRHFDIEIADPMTPMKTGSQHIWLNQDFLVRFRESRTDYQGT